MTFISCSHTFDQQTLTLMLEHDPLVQRYRAFFALFEWRVVPHPPIDPSQPGKRPHLQSAYIKAMLLKIAEGFQSQARGYAQKLHHCDPRSIAQL
jgi:hypothetical protein